MSFINISQWAADNLLGVHIQGRGTGGYAAGFGNLTAADTGQTSAMRRIRGSITAPIRPSGRTYVHIPGDGAASIASFPRDAAPSDYRLELSVVDTVLEKWLKQSSGYTLGEWDMIGRGQSAVTPRDSMLMLHRLAQTIEEDNEGENGYENLLVPSNVLLDDGGDDKYAYKGLADLASPSVRPDKQGG